MKEWNPEPDERRVPSYRRGSKRSKERDWRRRHEGRRTRREDFKHGRRWKERKPSGRARWAVNLYPGQPLGAISGSFEVPPWPGRRYKDKLCLRHRHAPPLYTIILQADPRNGHSISVDERRDVPRAPLLSLFLSVRFVYEKFTACLSPSYRIVFSSLPLRLVPEGNKDGSAYVQPATGGGARLPSVGRTNANDSSMQDGVGIQPRGAAVWCGLVPARCFYI